MSAWLVCFNRDRSLERAYQAYRVRLEHPNFNAALLSCSSLFQSLALRRQWGRVTFLDHVLMIGGILLPMAVLVYQRRCPEAYAPRRLSLRSLTKVTALLISRRVATYGSRTESFHNSWAWFLGYIGIYSRLVIIAMSVMLVQVGSQTCCSSLLRHLLRAACRVN